MDPVSLVGKQKEHHRQHENGALWIQCLFWGNRRSPVYDMETELNGSSVSCGETEGAPQAARKRSLVNPVSLVRGSEGAPPSAWNGICESRACCERYRRSTVYDMESDLWRHEYDEYEPDDEPGSDGSC